MRRIQQYFVSPVANTEFTLSLPGGSRVLAFRNEHSSIIAYAEVPDLVTAYTQHRYYVVNTGNELPQHMTLNYFVTLQDNNSGAVLHVFEIK